MIKLTDEEIRQAWVETEEREEDSRFYGVLVQDRAIAQAQLKKIVEWDRSACPHTHHKDDLPLNGRKDCYKCWQALLEEIEGKSINRGSDGSIDLRHTATIPRGMIRRIRYLEDRK